MFLVKRHVRSSGVRIMIGIELRMLIYDYLFEHNSNHDDTLLATHNQKSLIIRIKQTLKPVNL